MDILLKIIALLLSQIIALKINDFPQYSYYAVTDQVVIPVDSYKHAPYKIERNSDDITLPYTNKLDSLGQKTGLWVISHNGAFSIESYVSGKRNGISRYYMIDEKNNTYKLNMVEYYSNDTLCGQMQIFSSNDYALIDSISRVQPRFYAAARKCFDNDIERPDTFRQAYCREYENNVLKREGWIIYNDSEHPIVSSNMGEWKHY